MEKAYFNHLLSRLRRVKIWYLLVPLLLFSVICVLALRANNLHMITLRDAVYAADKNNTNTEAALQTLRSFVYGHMNTELATGDNVYPPIQLKYTYERLQAAEKSRVKTANDQAYHEAQVYCEQQNPAGFSGRGRVPCIEAYVKSHGGATENKIPDAMYKFNFASPTWSPDLAGWTLLIAITILLLLVLRLAADYTLRSLAR